MEDVQYHWNLTMRSVVVRALSGANELLVLNFRKCIPLKGHSRSASCTFVGHSANSLHHLRTFLMSVQFSPFTSVDWQWISIGVDSLRHRNLITEVIHTWRERRFFLTSLTAAESIQECAPARRKTVLLYDLSSRRNDSSL